MSVENNMPVSADMEINSEKTTSRELLTCGSGGGGLHDKLLLKSKAPGPPQTQRVPRSHVLDRLQSFLPQLAAANEKLKQQIEESPDGQFDIERVEDAEKVIEMDVALVELSDPEEETSGEDSASDSGEESEITEETLKLPHDKSSRKRADIQVMERQGD